MQSGQIRWSAQSGWEKPPIFSTEAQIVLVFGDADFFRTAPCYEQLRAMFPAAHILGCSSSGSILGVEISDGDVVATAVQFDHAKVRMAVADISPAVSVTDIGVQLMAELKDADLRHVFVLSDGLQVNGSELTQGLNHAGVAVTGGLAGDGSRFQSTWVMADAPAKQGRIVALGFYGDVSVKSGCFAGWVEFGAQRVVTKSVGNVVYEIDGKPALALYKKYLGEFASELPASGLRFPLSVQASHTAADTALIRTLLAVDEAAQSLTFAGDVPQGHLCKLMRTDLDQLIENAGMAAEAVRPSQNQLAGLCLVVSCVGRRLVMGQLTEDELEIVQDKLGSSSVMTGFYSYGELAPFSDVMQCQLHNQTMTMTMIYEH